MSALGAVPAPGDRPVGTRRPRPREQEAVLETIRAGTRRAPCSGCVNASHARPFGYAQIRTASRPSPIRVVEEFFGNAFEPGDRSSAGRIRDRLVATGNSRRRGKDRLRRGTPSESACPSHLRVECAGRSGGSVRDRIRPPSDRRAPPGGCGRTALGFRRPEFRWDDDYALRPRTSRSSPRSPGDRPGASERRRVKATTGQSHRIVRSPRVERHAWRLCALGAAALRYAEPRLVAARTGRFVDGRVNPDRGPGRRRNERSFVNSARIRCARTHGNSSDNAAGQGERANSNDGPGAPFGLSSREASLRSSEVGCVRRVRIRSVEEGTDRPSRTRAGGAWPAGGDRVRYLMADGSIRMPPARPICRSYGDLRQGGAPVSVERAERAIAEGATDERSRFMATLSSAGSCETTGTGPPKRHLPRRRSSTPFGARTRSAPRRSLAPRRMRGTRRSSADCLDRSYAVRGIASTSAESSRSCGRDPDRRLDRKRFRPLRSGAHAARCAVLSRPRFACP